MKPVLDMTAGGRMMWPSKKNELAVFVDKRFEVIEFVDRGNFRANYFSESVCGCNVYRDVYGVLYIGHSYAHLLINGGAYEIRTKRPMWSLCKNS